MTGLEIWRPKYSTKECLVLASKVKLETTEYCIYFTKDPEYLGKKYVMTGKQIKDNSTLKGTEQGGKQVYAIPLAVLETFKREL